MQGTDNNQVQVEIGIDSKNLFREEVYTDLYRGTIRRLIPVKSDGTIDNARKTMFLGQMEVSTPHGPLPITAPIEAKKLQQAIKGYPDAIKATLENLEAEIKKMEQEKDSRIIVPGQ